MKYQEKMASPQVATGTVARYQENQENQENTMKYQEKYVGKLEIAVPQSTPGATQTATKPRTPTALGRYQENQENQENTMKYQEK